MTSGHQINLSSVWELDDGKAGCRVNLMDSRESDQAVELKRKFNCPTGINGNTSVYLVFENLAHVTHVILNEVELWSTESEGRFGRFEVTGHLLPHNSVLVGCESLKSGTETKVYLELSDC